MLLTVNIQDKTIGAKQLLAGLRLTVAPKEKLAIIGRNGVGKTTLFNILAAADPDYEGSIEQRRGLRVVNTQQEHFPSPGQSAVAYIRDGLPDYAQLKHIIDTYPQMMGDDMTQITAYSQAVDRFSKLGYYDIEDRIVERLAAYQIPFDLAHGEFAKLSGGQKRFCELVRVELSDCDLALVDEPTNHMDYVAKAAFVDWLRSATHAVAVITHDRDVLQAVERIVELRDGQAYSFKGNYDAYLSQNSHLTVGQMDQYELGLRTMDKLKKQIAYARSKKAGWGGTADKKNPFVVMEERAMRQLAELEKTLQKPSFWIDQESVDSLQDKQVAKYEKYKARNINIRSRSGGKHVSELLNVQDLSLGYAKPLFAGISFKLATGDRLHLVGRNGVGKTTLVRALIEAASRLPASTWSSPRIAGDSSAAADSLGLAAGRAARTFAGAIKFKPTLKLGVYEQEVSGHLLERPLADAVMDIYRRHGLPLNQEQVRRVLAEYLFNPREDLSTPVAKLSGGQKARLQLIGMLAGDPNLLILDEPTNHLDLPSIEELEKALARYHGAIIYVSHDSYFARNLGGEELVLEAAI